MSKGGLYVKSFGLFFSRPYVEFQSANYTLVSNNDWASRRTVTFENGSKKKKKKEKTTRQSGLSVPLFVPFTSGCTWPGRHCPGQSKREHGVTTSDFIAKPSFAGGHKPRKDRLLKSCRLQMCTLKSAAGRHCAPYLCQFRVFLS